MVQTFDSVVSNPGVGGVVWTADTFTDDTVAKTIPYEALAFGPINGPYVPVTSSAGLPTNPTQWGGTAVTAAAALADGTSNPTAPLIGSCSHVWNGSTWDRSVGALAGTALSSAARTSTSNSPTLNTHGCRGIGLYLRISAASGTGGLYATVIGLDPVTAIGVLLNPAVTPITSTGMYVWILYPGVSVASTASTYYVSSALVTSSLILQIAHTDGSSYTYSLGYVLLN